MSDQFQWSSTTQDILKDFVFLDCRLADHPKLRSTVYLRSGDILQIFASTVSPGASPNQYNLTPESRKLTARIARNREYCVTSNKYIKLFEREIFQSLIVAPILNDQEAIGVVSVSSKEIEKFENKHLGRIQLLAALLGYSLIHLDGGIRTSTPISLTLGQKRQRVKSAFDPY